MADSAVKKNERAYKVRHRGRGAQVLIYLGKLLRTFVYQSDWKVLPMSALIAGLVGMVIRKRMFINMEGTIMGSFALVCVCIWNGCFNSIQSVCRERDVIKREHRSGLHISAYIASHMIYQLMICIAQTVITLYITKQTGVQYPLEGLFTPLFIVDIGISMLLITYASDMMSLWVSTLARSTTTAMTVMPFVLIFQLVFSGGMLTLPEWTKPLTNFTISNPGLKVIATQADTNNRPFVTISNMLGNMGDNELKLDVSVGQALQFLAKSDDPTIEGIRQEEIANGITVGDVIEELDTAEEFQEIRDEHIKYDTTVGRVVSMIGEDKVRSFLEERAAAASYKADYELTKEHVADYWLHLAAFVAAFSLLAMITLEFIDKDKR